MTEDLYEFLDYIIDNDISLEEKLQLEDLTMERAQFLMTDFTTKFQNLAKKYELPISSRTALCKKLLSLSEETKEEEFLWLYCAIINDLGLLLDTNRAERTLQQDISNYLTMNKNISHMYQNLLARKEQQINFDTLIAKIKKIRFEKIIAKEKKNFSRERDAVFQLYLNTWEVLDNRKYLFDNISMICTALNNEHLIKIAPLFIYQVFNKHRSNIVSNEIFNFSMPSLWKFSEYKIEKNNGKNFKANEQKLELYSNLRKIFARTKLVDQELSLYGFYVLSNLCDFYYEYFATNSEDAEGFTLPLEVFFDKSLFTCWENGNDDAVLFKDNIFSPWEISDFINVKHVRNDKIMEPIIKYINEHQEDFLDKFIREHANKQLVEKLIEDILLAANPPREYLLEELLPITYVAINILLLEMVDLWAEDILIRVGKSIISNSNL